MSARGSRRSPSQPVPLGRSFPPLPHCYIPQRVSSAVRTASLLLWSNNFAWARLFRELVGSAGTQQLPPFISGASPGGHGEAAPGPGPAAPPALAPGRWFPSSLPLSSQKDGFSRYPRDPYDNHSQYQHFHTVLLQPTEEICTRGCP